MTHDETDMLLVRRIKPRESKYWQLKYRCPECSNECTKTEIPAVKASVPTCSGGGLKLTTVAKVTVSNG